MFARSVFLAAAGALAIVPAAGAQLPVPVPDPTGAVDQVAGIVDQAPLPGPVTQLPLPAAPLPGGADPLAGIVDQVTGTAGGLAPAAPAAIQDALDALLAGNLPRLDPGAVDGLLGTIGVPALGANRSGAAGVVAPGNAAGTVVGAVNGVVDGRAPTVSVTVLSHLRVVRRTGRMVVRVASSEPSVVALAGTLRPGQKLKTKKARGKKARSAASFRAPIAVRRTLLAFRRQGALRLRISLPRSAQKRLGQARNARLALAVYAVDVARNQVTRNLKRQVKR